MNTNAPASRTSATYGDGSPKENITAVGPYDSTRATAPSSIPHVRNPTPHGRPHPATNGSSRSTKPASPPPTPTIPSPPASDTARASSPPAEPPMGARTMGC
ncbi:hypothetical protein SRB5_70940 [Streptomyces sp. RB5]|uniref:Uncharacterized protein n=1 Tax=Streptomyces smaragdinus TaxID=2585196 RepID=A0A7K0CTU5_9ACTN|nr:hypothetical protein [Streptomyces smaragdinus]